MANTDVAFGLRPRRHLSGSPYNGQHRLYYVPATDGTALFIGDPVVIVGDSNASEVQGFPAGTLSEVTRAAGGDGVEISGVVTGVLPVTDESTIYREASTERVLMVCDDPDVIFEIQDDGTGALTVDTVGLNAILIAGTGSTVTGRSGFEMDGGGGTGPSADLSNQLYIMSISKEVEQEVDDFAIWEVLINTHKFHGGVLGRVLGVA